MRFDSPLRVRAAGAALGALSTTTLLAGAPAVAQTPAPAPTASLGDASLRYGERLEVEGRTAQGAGTPLTLEYRARGETAWRAVDTTRAGEGGRYRLAVQLSRTGHVRVAQTDAGQAQAAAASAAPAPEAAPRSTERTVRVAARVVTREERLDVDAGRTAFVEGAVRRPHAGRTVALQARSGRGWKTLDRDRTDAAGRFRLSHRTKGSDSRAVRIRFSGDRFNAATIRELGRLNAYRRTFASWYGPGFYGKRTACGQTFSAGVMGVAHKSLPCGTRVSFRLGNRTAQARVIDRGPFAGGREFDLGPAVKRKLGFGSTGSLEVAH